MNERISLPAQEWLGYDPEKGDIHGYTFDQMKEFAQLIIQECANMAKAFHHHQYDFTGDLELHEYMKKHFGVE